MLSRLGVTASLSNYENISLSKRYMELDVSPQFNGYSGVEIVVDENTEPCFAGNRTGRVLTIENPWGTQEQADNILSSLQGFAYQPYTASGALLDPAAEIGDGVSLNGLYSGLYRISRNYSSLMATEISAPQDEEIDHEYPFETKGNREITRKFMAVESEFTLQSNKIEAKVSKQSPEGQTSFGWSLENNGWRVFDQSGDVFTVNSSGATVKGIITATGGKIGNFNIGNTAIWNNISAFNNPGGLTSGVYLGTNGIRLGQKFTVDPSGNVMATRLTVDTLVIGGSNVSAETLNSRANSAYTSTSAGGYCYNGGIAGTKFTNMVQTNGYPLWASSFRVDAGSRRGVQFTVQTIYYKDHAGNDRSAEVLASSIN